MTRLYAPIICLLMLLAIAARADDAAVAWRGKAVNGTPIVIPSESKWSTLLLFVIPSQPRTHDALVQFTQTAQEAKQVQIVVVLSGDGAAARAGQLQQQENCSFPIVADTDYALSGRLAVRAWPTTVLVSPDGRILAHLAGLPKHYTKNLETHLAFAAGSIDAAEFQKRLDAPELIVDDPRQMAQRHLTVAQRLLDKGLPDQARIELNKSLQLQPDSSSIKLAMSRALLTLGDVEQAVKLLDTLNGDSVPEAELNLLRGRALSAQGKHEDAIRILQQATRLNPNPAEAWYELGLVYERRSDWTKAAEAFRKAFETTDAGRKIRPAGR